MYRKDNNTGEVIGVLADFDLSSLKARASGNTERTSTVPFMALDLLSTEALAGEVEHDYGHEAEAYFWVGVYDTACYDNGHTVDSAVPAGWNSLGAIAMGKGKLAYLSKLHKHVDSLSQKDVWNGLSLLWVPSEPRGIFKRPTELDPIQFKVMNPKLLPLDGATTFDASVQEPKAVRDHFLLVKRHAEGLYPTLLNKTSTSSS
jgi:hypothetical protein